MDDAITSQAGISLPDFGEAFLLRVLSDLQLVRHIVLVLKIESHAVCHGATITNPVR